MEAGSMGSKACSRNSFPNTGALAPPAGHQQDAAAAEDGADADGEGLTGDGVLAGEEPGIGRDGLLRELFEVGVQREGRAGHIEGDVAVGADAEQGEVKTAGCLDCLRVFPAGPRKGPPRRRQGNGCWQGRYRSCRKGAFS